MRGQLQRASPLTWTACFSRSISSSPIFRTRLGLGRGAAEDCAEAGEQLVHSERLRHVVVGARVESGDLLLLVADDGEDEHRGVAPFA